MSGIPPPEVSIAISTFRRPGGLRRLLEGLKGLDPSSPRFEVVVVDNDAGETARPIVEEGDVPAFDLRYFVEPVQNIARARNRGVREASGRFVAFIDDDEWPDPLWLIELWRVAHEADADGVIGPVRAMLPQSTPRWLEQGGFFQRESLQTGRPVAWWQTTTANALIRRQALISLPTLFDEAFGLSGGSDSELFQRMLAHGCRLVGSDKGIVFEAIGPSRVKAGWLLKRHFRNGMTSARLVGRRHAGLRLARHGAKALLSLPLDRIQGFRCLLRSAAALGELASAAGFRYEPYRDSRKDLREDSAAADTAQRGAEHGA